MKSRRIFAAAALVLSAAAVRGQTAEPPEVDFVTYIPDLGAEISAADAEKHMRLYATFLEEQGVARATVKLMDNVKELERYVATRDPERPTFGVLQPLVVGLMRESWGLEPLAMPVQDGSPLAARVVVALRGSGIEGMEGLRGKSLVITKPFEELPEILGLLLWGKPERADVALGQLMLAETSAQAAVAVLQRKADAALLNGYVYKTSRKQVKQVWQNLEVVGETTPMHLAPVVAFKGAPPELAKKLTDAILRAGGSKAGKDILEAFKLDEFRPMSVADLAAVEGKMLAAMAVARSAATITVTSTQRMGADVGVTLMLPAALQEGEKAVVRYRAADGAEASATLRCITRTCTGMLTAAAGQKVSAAIFATGADGTERHVGACELTAP